MAEGKILQKNIRFPKETLPQGIDFIEDKFPEWIEEIEVHYDDSILINDSEDAGNHGKYIIKRLHGPSAGSEDTPVYMDEQGQPQPINNISSSLLDSVNFAEDSEFIEKVDEALELDSRIAGAAVNVVANSNILSIEKTEEGTDVTYTINENINDTISNLIEETVYGGENHNYGTVYSGSTEPPVDSGAMIWITQ